MNARFDEAAKAVADGLERRDLLIVELYDALRIFIDDERFQVTIGGNPNVVDRALAQARAGLANAEPLVAYLRGEQSTFSRRS